MYRFKPSSMSLAKFFFGTIGALGAIVAFLSVGPVIETTFFPVMSKMKITSVEAATDSSSIVNVRFTKKRDCEYMGMAWYHMLYPNVFDRVSMIPIRDPEDTSSPNRIVGTQNAGPWRVSMPAADVKKKSYVVIYHRCFSFWTTRTEFYP